MRQYDPLSYEANLRLMQSFAWKVLRRAHAAGLRSLEFQDVMGELSIAYCIARDNYKVNVGTKFTTYLFTGMMRHINRWLQKEIENNGKAAISLDDHPMDEANSTMHEVIGDENEEDPELKIIRQDVRANILNRLQPRSRQFVELLENPPAEVVEAFLGLRAKAQYARDRCIGSVAPSQITSAIIFDLMGCQRPERCAIYRDIRDVTQRFSK